MFNQTLSWTLGLFTIFHNENAAINILVHKSLFRSPVIFPASIPRSGIAGSEGGCMSKVPDAYREAACLRESAVPLCPPICESARQPQKGLFSLPQHSTYLPSIVSLLQPPASEPCVSHPSFRAQGQDLLFCEALPDTPADVLHL